MKTKYPNLFGILAALMLVVSFVVPASLASPTNVAADPGVCKWDNLSEPAIIPNLNNVVPNEILDFSIASDGQTIDMIAKAISPSSGLTLNMLFDSPAQSGLFFSLAKYVDLATTPGFRVVYPAISASALPRQLYNVVISPDDPNFRAVTSDGGNPTDFGMGPKEVWVSRNGGANWENAQVQLKMTSTSETIRCIDISVDYGGKRDIAVGTVKPSGLGQVLVIQSTGFTGWVAQTPLPPESAAPSVQTGFFALKFSPSYPSDGSLALVFATDNATYYNVALRDLANNILASPNYAFTSSVIVGDPANLTRKSPTWAMLNKAVLQLPSDFSGQAASLRRAYISLDVADCNQAKAGWDGIVRVDDTTVYILMDTSNVADKTIYSIAYFGTYASGKLLAGERMGYPCTATVPTWFTDSPTTCPVPCWYPCLKCPTGAACLAGSNGVAFDGVHFPVANCPGLNVCPPGSGKTGVGAAIVAWRPNGQLAFVGTGGLAVDNGQYWFIVPALGALTPNDESAFGISRNNGETWNQTAMIDTTITKFTDIAPTPDCKTVYLASVNACGATNCCFSVTANVSGSSTVAPTITFKTPTVGSGCSAGTYVVSTANTTSVTYNPGSCTITYSITYSLVAHCGCSTCTSCTVTSNTFSVGTVTPAVLQTNNGTFTSVAVPISVCVDCSTQPGCATTQTGCCCFDSVWRTSSNPDVVSPLAALPVGTYWERIWTHVTAQDCTKVQTDVALLRIVPYCADPTGEIVAWGVYDPTGSLGQGVAFWSPDFGDYWAPITLRSPIQDFAFESRTMLYFLSPNALVQKMPFTGSSWSTSLKSLDSQVQGAHTIVAQPEGKILIGKSSLIPYAGAYSLNMNTDNPTFGPFFTALTLAGNAHVAFDPDFDNNNMVYFATDGAGGSVFRNNITSQLLWTDTDMMAAVNGAVGCPSPDSNRDGFYGIQLAFTGSALYAAGGEPVDSQRTTNGGVWRTIDDGTGRYGPLSGMPKPGIAWDKLIVGLPAGVVFTAEPWSLKICGCCTLDTDTTVYALDNRNYSAASNQGRIWRFTDCLAKRGPALVTEDKLLIGCDPVSGRAQEVNLCWEQLCVADQYDLEISKNTEFNILVVNMVDEDDCNPAGFEVQDVTSPCVFFPAGGLASVSDSSAIGFFGNLECGHTYYWRVKARNCATTQISRSPWSEARSFTVKAGLPVVSPYLGLQLLAPNNGCLGCPVQPVSFSWSPFKETTKYKFVLAKDAAMTQIVKEAEVATTAYEYDGALDYSTNYFWRVMSEEPAPSDWSATFSFQTEAKPVPVAETAAPAPTPIWVWVVIAIGAILVIVTLVLIFKTRRV